MGSVVYCQQCGGETEQQERDGRLRPVCTRCGRVTWFDPRLAVAVVIERHNSVLLGKRGPGVRAPGLWGLPAGFVERGEVVEAAAVREVREETGLDVAVGAIQDVVSYEGESVVLLVFAATEVAGEPAPGDDLVEIGWFSLDALPQLAFVHDRSIIEAHLGANREPVGD
ncbi:MAG: NUDIX hydrolase [Thermomicrobiales bacterium]|nr:NUDIX hydrolase [Thermomicrobiales bacterium]